MSKVKYYYDAETLSYRKIERKKRRTLKFIALFLLAAGLFGFLIVFIGTQYIESPKERQLARELQNMQLQYELLNRKEEVSITTYRDGDMADTGYRKTIQTFGFTESELLFEFGYPTQKFLFRKHNAE